MFDWPIVCLVTWWLGCFLGWLVSFLVGILVGCWLIGT